MPFLFLLEWWKRLMESAAKWRQNSDCAASAASSTVAGGFSCGLDDDVDGFCGSSWGTSLSATFVKGSYSGHVEYIIISTGW